MGKKQNREYTLEFKQQAAELATRIGSSNAARQLGVPMQSVHSWKQNLKNKEPQSKKVKIDLQEENRRLEKENSELKKVNHILKMAAAFFSKDHLK